jgi:hypothetical protein
LSKKICYLEHRFDFEHGVPYRWANAIAASPHHGLERVLTELLQSRHGEAGVGALVDITGSLAISPGLRRDKALIEVLERIPDDLPRDRQDLMRERVRDVLENIN